MPDSTSLAACSLSRTSGWFISRAKSFWTALTLGGFLRGSLRSSSLRIWRGDFLGTVSRNCFSELFFCSQGVVVFCRPFYRILHVVGWIKEQGDLEQEMSLHFLKFVFTVIRSIFRRCFTLFGFIFQFYLQIGSKFQIYVIIVIFTDSSNIIKIRSYWTRSSFYQQVYEYPCRPATR